jgi:Rod binding domain-containing protein
LNEEIGKSIAKNGGIGLSDAVYRELLKAQEV